MTIDEREYQLDSQLALGEITFEEWARAWIDAQQDEVTYPNGDK